MTLTLDKEIIKEHIIHRFENLLLDHVHVEKQGAGQGDLDITISDNDELGRDIFLKETTVSKTIAVPVYMEILALASIVVTGKLKSNEMAIFAGISNFELLQKDVKNATLTGNVSQVSDKGGFLKYKGELANSDGPVCSGDMVAFFTTIEAEAEAPQVGDIEFESNCDLKLNKEGGPKPAIMTICDSLSYCSESACIGQYSYPEDHPFIKGHFPGNPLMMGVMQWMSVEDTLAAYFEKQGKTGESEWSCNARLYNQHKQLVCDIKQIKARSWIGVDSRKNQVQIEATKRISFKNMVKPGDSLTISIQDISPL